MLTPTDHPAATEVPALTPLPDALAASDAIPNNREAGSARDQRSVPMDASSDSWRLDHLRALEAESLHIIREVVAEFPLLHVDTMYKFRKMVTFGDRYARQVGARLIAPTNKEAIAEGTQPFAVGTQRCCGLLKTKSLLDALEAAALTGLLAVPGATMSVRAPRNASSVRPVPWDCGRRSGSIPSSDIYSTAASGWARASASSRSRTEPNSTSGTTSKPSRFRLPRARRRACRVAIASAMVEPCSRSARGSCASSITIRTARWR